MSVTQYFRIGAGSVIYNEAGEILLFQRSDNRHIWQLQQGGMDPEETIEDTLWRELEEETGLTPADFSTVTQYPDWLSYTYPDSLRQNLKDINCRGQIHRWFFLKLKPGATIDLSQVADKEFVDYRFSTFADFLALGDTLKKDVYEKLASYYATHIHTT